MPARLELAMPVATLLQTVHGNQARKQQKGTFSVSRAEVINVVTFLETHGFKGNVGDVNASKSAFFKSTYPLHVAVKEQDVHMVRLLLLSGANKFLKNSSGNTPVEKAWKYYGKLVKEASSQIWKDGEGKDAAAARVARMVLLALGEDVSE